MPSSVLGLPSIPPPLKSIAPFLQRAEEVRSQDPVVAYWCTWGTLTILRSPLICAIGAYYAAQVGISLKTKDTQSRNVLLELLGVLERMKKDIGANDALDVEVAGVAYVENFALKVFAAADNEDRRGEATRYRPVPFVPMWLDIDQLHCRATAKKFLAAANFLEVLNIFPTSDSLETVSHSLAIMLCHGNTSPHRTKRRSAMQSGRPPILPKLCARVAGRCLVQRFPNLL